MLCGLFSSRGEQGYSLAVVLSFPISVASLVVGHGL